MKIIPIISSLLVTYARAGAEEYINRCLNLNPECKAKFLQCAYSHECGVLVDYWVSLTRGTSNGQRQAGFDDFLLMLDKESPTEAEQLAISGVKCLACNCAGNMTEYLDVIEYGGDSAELISVVCGEDDDDSSGAADNELVASLVLMSSIIFNNYM